MSRLDVAFRSLLLTKFFTKGWGNPDNLKRIFEFRKIISNRETCRNLVRSDYPVTIDKVETQKEVKIIEGHFLSPFVEHMPGIMLPEVQTARFQMVLPVKWHSKWGDHLKPVCVHLAGTGDHGFYRRRQLLARPLIKQAGIASVLLENPFYGTRKPKKQVRSMLHNVSDLFVMGGALVLESLVLFHWCEKQGYGPLGITGISMGGHMASAAATDWHKPLTAVPCISWTTASCIFTEMASLAASNWHKPIPLIPCLSWSTASSVFTQGVLSGAIDWRLLEKQYTDDKVYEDELIKHICSPEQDRKNRAFQLGLNFVRNFPDGVDEIGLYQKHYCSNQNEGEPVISKLNSDTCDQSQTVHENKSFSENQSSSNLSNASMPYHHSAPLFTQESNKNKTTSSISSHFASKLSENMSHLKRKERNKVQQEAIDFMRGVMDECTHLGNFSVPVDPSLIIIVVAKDDAYIPRDSVLSLQDLWPGSQVRYVDTGHIGAFLTKLADFREAIVDGFDLQVKKYYS